MSLDFFELRFADVEEKLSQLTLWVIEAERARQPYGLRLPGVKISPALGQMHFHSLPARFESVSGRVGALCGPDAAARRPYQCEHEHE